MSANYRGEGVCAPAGFKAAGIAAGIKQLDALDVASVVSDRPATAAGVFTTNKVKAASVLLSQRFLAERDTFRAIICSSGNANAATGEQGLGVANKMCAAAAAELGCSPGEVLIAQTGLIGIPLDAVIAAAGAATAVRKASEQGGRAAARALLTTDTREKLATATCDIGGTHVTVSAMAKGAAMLAPAMATMLAVLTTDVAAEPAILRRALADAMPDSFSSLIVDGCTSTNDTVFLLANGASGASVAGGPDLDASGYTAFAAAVRAVCASLAEQMAHDAEGATKFLTVKVHGAASMPDARRAAKAVAGSLLIKCSLAGEDPYWGRVLADIGASGAHFDPGRVVISYGGTVVCRFGAAAAHDAGAVKDHMATEEIEIGIDLGAGDFCAHAFGCDLTHAYVTENMGTS